MKTDSMFVVIYSTAFLIANLGIDFIPSFIFLGGEERRKVKNENIGGFCLSDVKDEK